MLKVSGIFCDLGNDFGPLELALIFKWIVEIVPISFTLSKEISTISSMITTE